MTSMRIQVDHVTRLEGHGNIVALLREGKVDRAIFQVVEANRFFESILVGQTFDQVAHIASRICGICAVSHTCASLQATESAFGVEISRQTKLLRRLLMNGEQLSSHALHVYFLAAPDFLGLQSVVPLVQSDPETVKRAFRIKKTGYDLAEVLVGRHTHPVGAVPGGFTTLPRVSAMEKIRDRLVALREDLAATVSLYQKLDLPQFERPTECVSLRHPDHYSFLGGDIVSSEGHAVEASRYREAFKDGPLRLVQAAAECSSAEHLFAIGVPGGQRDNAIRVLNEAGIGVTVNYRAVTETTYYKRRFPAASTACPVARQWGEETLCLPLYPGIRDEEQDYVIETVRRAVYPLV